MRNILILLGLAVTLTLGYFAVTMTNNVVEDSATTTGYLNEVLDAQ